jgi:hypothetical protein
MVPSGTVVVVVVVVVVAAPPLLFPPLEVLCVEDLATDRLSAGGRLTICALALDCIDSLSGVAFGPLSTTMLDGCLTTTTTIMSESANRIRFVVASFLSTSTHSLLLVLLLLLLLVLRRGRCESVVGW